MLRRVLLAGLLVLVALPASAHTDEELIEWKTEWMAQAASDGLTATLVDELVDWTDRHPCRAVLGTWRPLCEPSPVISSSSNPPSSPPGNTGMGSDVEQWRVSVALWFGANTDAALRVMRCESGGNPNAQHPGSLASGLFQFLPSTWRTVTGEDYPGNVFHGPSNIAAAAKLSSGGTNWGAWVCKP